MLNEDYKEMLQLLLKNRVEFLVVGAYAMGLHGYPRATGDFDLWIAASPKNSANVYNSLKEFGAPLPDQGYRLKQNLQGLFLYCIHYTADRKPESLLKVFKRRRSPESMHPDNLSFGSDIPFPSERRPLFD